MPDPRTRRLRARDAFFRRVAGVRDLLRPFDRSVTQIAIEFGFCDASAFCRVFRAATGATPTQYRDRHLPAARK
jgi:transcriptional regulator GlxA family with amidase domain